MNPAVRIPAHANYLEEARGLRIAGTDVVVAGEGEVALGFTEATSSRGATRAQIDRERSRVHAELAAPGSYPEQARTGSGG